MPRRRKDRVDGNQREIVKTLRQIPGLTVETGHDDLLIGYKGFTFWFEVKSPEVVGPNGVQASAIKPDQKRLQDEFTGHYQIVWNIDQILEAIGVPT